jgi:hypothetical protein
VWRIPYGRNLGFLERPVLDSKIVLINFPHSDTWESNNGSLLASEIVTVVSKDSIIFLQEGKSFTGTLSKNA